MGPSKYYEAPSASPPIISYTQSAFNDSTWENVTLLYDWAIKGPFYEGDDVPVTGGMGRLPIRGISWYKKKISVATENAKKVVYLNIDGAQSYAIVWLNGNLVGGWPYGYNSFRLDLTYYLKAGDENQLAIRLV